MPWVITVEPHLARWGPGKGTWRGKHGVQCPDCWFGLYHKNADKMVELVKEHGRKEHGWTKDPKVVRKGYPT